MENFLRTFLIIHIFAGILALLSGIIAIFSKKGMTTHNISGSVYYWSMIVIGFTAFGIAIPKGNMFLLMIGGFSTYMTLTGVRFLTFRKNSPARFRPIDFCFVVLGLITLIVPTWYFTQIGWGRIGGFAIVFLVFGLFLLSMLVRDLKNSTKLSTYPKVWFLRMHISRMMGAFIATVTAFLVQNWQSDPVFIAWLLPTVIFTPVIIYFQKQLNPKKKNRPTLGLHE